MSNIRVGFIGSGVMGSEMAGHLQASKYELTVFNRSEKNRTNWKNKFKGRVSSSLQEIAESSNVIILCISKDEDVEEVINGNEGMLKNLKEGTIIIDHSTTSSELPIKMNKLLVKFYESSMCPIGFLATALDVLEALERSAGR